MTLLLKSLVNDAAENSIMQTITIAVYAILIAAGLVTAPGLINNARDNNARQDLANIAYAQEFTLGTTGSCFEGQYVTIAQEAVAEGIPTTEARNNLQYVASNLGVFGLGTQVVKPEDNNDGIAFTFAGDTKNHSVAVCTDTDNQRHLAQNIRPRISLIPGFCTPRSGGYQICG